ncbi:MAG: RNA polymerase sigma factor [Patescibacteria group bacterium]|nr:RNA polymerase sigma factor [Patescibacteria group bacterium]
MDKTDEELVADYLGGEENAFGELAKRHLPSAYSFALRFVGSREEAEDIAQETFLKAWKNLKQYRKEASKFKTWLLRITRNTAIDFLRKKKNIAFSGFENESGENVLAETVADQSPLPEELFAKAGDSQEVNQALLQLSPRHRELLLLYYTNDLTFQEIGEVLGESQNTTKSRHRRALQALRKILEQRGHSHPNTPE